MSKQKTYNLAAAQHRMDLVEAKARSLSSELSFNSVVPDLFYVIIEIDRIVALLEDAKELVNTQLERDNEDARTL